MTTSFSRVETEDGTTPIATLNEPEGERVCQSGERIGVSQSKHSHGHDLTPMEREAAQARCGEAIVRHMTLRALALQRHGLTKLDADKSKSERHRIMADEFSRLMVQLMAGSADGR